MGVTIRMADGDFFLNSAGRTETVEGASKSAQDIGEILMTPLDGLRDYGSELSSMRVPAIVSVFAGKALVSRKVDEAIQRLKRFQERDPNAGPDERIDKINKLVVDQTGTTDFVFWINVFLQDRSITSDRILAVSLRHQESAWLTTPMELAERIRR